MTLRIRFGFHAVVLYSRVVCIDSQGQKAQGPFLSRDGHTEGFIHYAVKDPSPRRHGLGRSGGTGRNKKINTTLTTLKYVNI